MTTPAGVVTEFAHLLLLLRDQPAEKEEQRSAFKRFATTLSEQDHSLRLTSSGFVWDHAAVQAAPGELEALYSHLRGHGIGEIRFPVGLMSSTLIALMRLLAAPAGTYGSFDHLVARLDAAGCGVVQVHPLPPAELAPQLDPRMRPAAGADKEGRLTALGPGALTEAQVGMMHFVSLQSGLVNPTMEVMSRLAQADGGAATTEALTQLLAAGEMAARQGEWGEVCRAAYGLVELEKKAPREEHRGYGIALRRMLPRTHLERVARLTAHGTLKSEATAVLRRMGADGTEVLLNLLVNSEEMNERRHYFSALKEMTEGGKLLVHMLSHDQWYVVRNVADLCGELREERAVHSLAKHMHHEDERVRRAVAGALAKIGGPGAVEPLRRAFRDPSASVRLQAAQDLDGRKNKGLAMVLAVAADEESRADVQREMHLALGRIGSAEAIQALTKAAEPGRRTFLRRKPVAVRLSAIEGLHIAGPSGSNALKDLLNDEEPAVREAVQKALVTLWE
ncbi:MAG TPA: HEAT repeat domain-containing protein [Gemmatimonadales bacterium]|nr:HEAT repeat domain-containing protein [Gemmatimonadales bacterium]